MSAKGLKYRLPLRPPNPVRPSSTFAYDLVPCSVVFFYGPESSVESIGSLECSGLRTGRSPRWHCTKTSCRQDFAEIPSITGTHRPSADVPDKSAMRCMRGCRDETYISPTPFHLRSTVHIAHALDSGFPLWVGCMTGTGATDYRANGIIMRRSRKPQTLILGEDERATEALFTRRDTI